MTALGYAQPDAFLRCLGIGQTEKSKKNFIACRTPGFDAFRITSSRQSCLKGEAVTPLDMLTDSSEHSSPGFQGYILNRCGIQAAGDFVCIQKNRILHHFRQKAHCIGCLAGSVGASNNEYCLRQI